MYLSADTFGPVFALVEKWAYLQEGTRGDEVGGAYTWRYTVYDKVCCIIFSIIETLSQYMKKAYI